MGKSVSRVIDTGYDMWKTINIELFGSNRLLICASLAGYVIIVNQVKACRPSLLFMILQSTEPSEIEGMFSATWKFPSNSLVLVDSWKPIESLVCNRLVNTVLISVK
jgi:hypothetical protein